MGVGKGGRGAGGGEYILGLPEVNTTTYGLKCHYYYCDTICFIISSFLEIDFAMNISDKKSRRFDLSEVIFKCIKVL